MAGTLMPLLLKDIQLLVRRNLLRGLLPGEAVADKLIVAPDARQLGLDLGDLLQPVARCGRSSQATARRPRCCSRPGAAPPCPGSERPAAAGGYRYSRSAPAPPQTSRSGRTAGRGPCPGSRSRRCNRLACR